jgi:hypothetical protein
MKHLKIYEDYSDEEIDSLISDLGDVGHAKSVRVSCIIKNATPQILTNPSWWIEYPEIFAIVNFPDRGNEEGNKRFALVKIQKGEFDQNLEVLSADEAEVLNKGNIQKIGMESSTLDDFVAKVGDEFGGVIFSQWEKLVEKYLESKLLIIHGLSKEGLFNIKRCFVYYRKSNKPLVKELVHRTKQKRVRFATHASNFFSQA